MRGESIQGAYDWIRYKDADAEIDRDSPLLDYFPNGPSEEPQKWIDIVIVTPDSMS